MAQIVKKPKVIDMNLDFEEEIESLQRVLERLDEIALDTLRELIHEGDSGLKEFEKRVHRARRALSRAITELSRNPTSDDEDY